MAESVQAQHIMLAAMAGAMVVLFGAVHALFLAFAKLQDSRKFLRLSRMAYLLFTSATLVLAWTLRLSGFWFLVVVVMLVGYLLAPHGIWHLSVATHRSEHEKPAAASPNPTEGGSDHE